MIDMHYLQCHFFSQAEEDKTRKNPVSRTYKISEAARIFKVQTSTLRYWETVFPDYLHPVRSRGGQRVYTEKDMDALKRIHDLLHTQRMTIEGALKVLGGLPMPEAEIALRREEDPENSGECAGQDEGGKAAKENDVLAGILLELRQIRELLDSSRSGEEPV